MNKLLLAVLLPLAAPAAALEGPEAVRFSASAAFRAPAAKPALRRLEARQAEKAAPARANAKTGQRLLRLSGWVNLHGSGHVSPGQHSAYVTVSGWTNLQDETGRSLSGSVSLSDTSFYWLNGSHVSGWARPYAYVSVYSGSRFLGTVRVEGNIHVSGWNNNGWVNLSGSGRVEGSAWVDDSEDKP